MKKRSLHRRLRGILDEGLPSRQSARVHTLENPAGDHAPSTFLVTEAESGQKLMQLLVRRLDLAQNLLHRWVRTGQIRLNSARCKPFERVHAGDSIRLPPFARKMVERSVISREVPSILLPGEVNRHGEIVFCSKPAGLPTHPGTSHTDSLSGRIKTLFPSAPFVPVPAHRLDKDTSGLLLVALSFSALRSLNEDLKAGRISKEYLCWVEGAWERKEPVRLTDTLAKRNTRVGERVQKVEAGGREAVSLVAPVVVGSAASLLVVRILTGRTHQIRVQLSALSHPVLGDHKYGHGDSAPRLLLHAARLRLADGFVCTDLPHWQRPYEVPELPDLQLLDQAMGPVPFSGVSEP